MNSLSCSVSKPEAHGSPKLFFVLFLVPYKKGVIICLVPMERVLPVQPQYFVRAPLSDAFAFFSVGVERREKDSRGCAEDTKEEGGHWKMKAVCICLWIPLSVSHHFWQSSCSKA